MKMDLRGIEYDWLAVDKDGHLGFFSTAGSGFYPVLFAKNLEIYQEMIGFILTLSECTDTLFAPHLSKGVSNDWRDFAARGFYAFDGDPSGGPYRKVAAPVSPILVSDILLESIRSSIEKIKFELICFQDLSVIKKNQAYGIEIYDFGY